MKTLKTLIAEIEKSNFECEACYLNNFIAFIELKEKVNNVNSQCCLGSDHPCPLNVNDGYCAAESCQYKVIKL